MTENNKIKKLIDSLKASWITLWLVIVAVLLCVTTTYAAYTGVKTSKRVISLSDRDDMLFSSRYMFVNGSDVQKVSFAEGTEDPYITIDVCNYDKSGVGKYGSDIYFKVTARLVNYDGTAIDSALTSDKYYIAFSDDEDESAVYKLSELTNVAQTIPGPETVGTNTNLFLLPGSAKNKLKFVLHCDSTALTNPIYAVEVTATPVGDYDDIKKISGKMAAVSRSSVNLEWSGEFTDQMIDTDPSKFDAYNYVISGVGTGTITLTYDNTALELDMNDLSVFSALAGYTFDDTTTNGKTVITFSVDTTIENAVSRYAIHFYRKNGLAIPAFSETYVKTEFRARQGG